MTDQACLGMASRFFVIFTPTEWGFNTSVLWRWLFTENTKQ